MAAYGTDLTDITTADSGTVVEPAAPYDGGLQGVLNTELFLQGTSSFSSEGKNAVGNLTNGVGVMFNSTQTFASEEVVLGWGYFAFPTTLYSEAGRGWSFLIGSSTSAYDVFTVGGDDVTPMPYGGWYNYAIDPTQTETVTVGGGNGGTYTHFGFGAFLRAKISKGDCMAMDALRIGRAEIYCTGTACTFTGMATENDLVANRWGLFQDVGGSYAWKGLLSFGQTATSATFSDSNKTINIVDMKFVYAAFNKIEVHNASTSVTLTNISINSTSTVSPGNFEMIANATVAKTGCTFNSMGTFVYQSNATITSCIFNSCGVVTQDGATFTGCTFNAPTTTGLVVDDLTLVTGSTFISAGTGHAVDLGTIAATTSLDWDAVATGYAATDGVTGNETIAVTIQSPNVLTINSLAGATKPTIHKTGTGTVTVLEAQVTIAVTVLDDDTGSAIGTTARVLLYDKADYSTEILNAACSAGGVASTTQSYTADIEVEGWVREMSVSGTDYTPVDISGTVTSTGFAITVRLKPLN